MRHHYVLQRQISPEAADLTKLQKLSRGLGYSNDYALSKGDIEGSLLRFGEGEPLKIGQDTHSTCMSLMLTLEAERGVYIINSYDIQDFVNYPSPNGVLATPGGVVALDPRVPFTIMCTDKVGWAGIVWLIPREKWNNTNQNQRNTRVKNLVNRAIKDLTGWLFEAA
jgi:hypothetical protein